MTTLAHGGARVLGAAEKRLAAAVAASIAVHAAAWYLVPPLHTQIAPLARTLEVLLIAKPPEPPPAAEPERQPPPARPAPAAAKPRPVERAPRPAAPREVADAPREPAPVAAQESAQPAPAILARPPGPAQAPVAAAAPSPELLAGYGSSISRLLARHREYPRVALMRGWEGTVTMRLRVAPGGKLIDARVEGSSGHQVLDTQALEMVKRVPDLPPPPESLRDREFAVLVPVVFRLER
jgi:protein TonB